jgi:hypothetical protein
MAKMASNPAGRARQAVRSAFGSVGNAVDPARCFECGVVYSSGRWSWEAVPVGAYQQLCPACRRIQDRSPGGHVTITGEFAAARRDEILRRVRECEADQMTDRPLERIVAVEHGDRGMVVTTTDASLARSIGEMLRAAYRGRLSFRYSYEKKQRLLRVSWAR